MMAAKAQNNAQQTKTSTGRAILIFKKKPVKKLCTRLMVNGESCGLIGPCPDCGKSLIG